MLKIYNEFPLQSQILLGDFDQKTKYDFVLHFWEYLP